MRPRGRLTIVRVTTTSGYAWYALIEGARHLIKGPPTKSAGVAHLRAIEAGFVTPGPQTRIEFLTED